MSTISAETTWPESNNHRSNASRDVGGAVDRLSIDYLFTEDRKQAAQKVAHFKSGGVLVIHFNDGPKAVVEEGVSTIMQLFTAMSETLLKQTEKGFIEQMVNMAIPRQVQPPHVLKEAAMTIKARERVLASGDLMTAADIARLAGFSDKNPSAQPNKWKRAGLVFAIQHKGTDYFPSYALDPENSYRPRKAMAEILKIFNDTKSDWGKAYWFASDNSFLGGKRPQDALATMPERVIAAAEDEVEGVVHG